MTTYEIGPFRVDPAAKAVTQAGAPVALGPRAVAVLALLVESAPEYVPKTRLIDGAWPGVVVEEANLAVQMSAIRRVLARVPGGEQWIETLSRRGYRFVGPVTKPVAQTPRESGPSNLPASLTSFVGRERELAEIQKLLEQQRLLTLTGAGGVGKTRLALRVADTALRNGYSDGVWLVELAAISDPNLVPQAVGTVLGLREQGRKHPIETLTEYLRPRRVLLMLDNAEHLVAACAQLTEAVLRRCPHVTWLVTSRERLGVDGELTYRVPSLPVPDPRRDTTVHAVAACDSVRLFSERVRLHASHFAVTDRNASAMAHICRRLDGIPLAIELAAARVRSMSVQEVNERLARGLRVLTNDSRTALPRQQTLRALIDWSYELLGEAERALLRRVSVFAGGWTLAHAESVCTDAIVEKQSVLDRLASLTDKSLALAEERDGETRYRLLETVRQYAQGRLREDGEEARWRSRHLVHFAAFAQEAESGLRGTEQSAWLERLETEHDNLRHALDWAESADPDAGLRIASAAWWFWGVRGHLSEGRRRLAALLAAAPSAKTPTIRAKALRGAGDLARRQSDFDAAEALVGESLAVWRELGDEPGIASALSVLASVAVIRGDYAAAQTLDGEALAIMRKLGDRFGIAGRLITLAIASCEQGDYGAARNRLEESLAIYRELGSRWGISIALNNLGMVASSREDYATARALLEESLAFARDLAARREMMYTLNDLASVVCAQGDDRYARILVDEALALARELGDRWGLAGTLEVAGFLASALGVPSRAARLWGCAQRLREELGTPRPPTERVVYDRCVASARAAMDDDAAFAAAWQEGLAMTLEQAIDCALDEMAPDVEHV